MDIDTLQGLRRCPLFNGLTESEIIDLMHKVRYRVVRCCKGEFHAIEGSVCQYADIIIQGEMVASMMGPSGRIIRVADHQSGKLLAPAFFFASDNQYPVTVEATTDTTVFRLMPADLEKILSHDPRLMMNYIKILSNVVSHLTKKVRMLSMSVRSHALHECTGKGDALSRGANQASTVERCSSAFLPAGTGRSFRYPEIFVATVSE